MIWSLDTIHVVQAIMDLLLDLNVLKCGTDRTYTIVLETRYIHMDLSGLTGGASSLLRSLDFTQKRRIHELPETDYGKVIRQSDKRPSVWILRLRIELTADGSRVYIIHELP